jgi:hypothetical protein
MLSLVGTDGADLGWILRLDAARSADARCHHSLLLTEPALRGNLRAKPAGLRRRGDQLVGLPAG